MQNTYIPIKFLYTCIQMIVAGFSGRTDISKAAETANDVRRVMKELKECQQQASLCNQRERLFNLPVTQVREELEDVRII